MGVMYRPPVSSKHLSKDFDNQLHSMHSTISESSQETTLLGDLNANFLKQEDKDKELKAVLRVYALKQLITKPNRITGSCESLLDVILTSCPESVARTEVSATSIGNHEMVGCIRKLNCSSFKPRKIICRNYKNYRPDDLNKDLESLDWSPLYKFKNVNEAWAQIKEALNTVYEHHAPKICKHVKGKPDPLLNPAVKKLMNERDKLLHKYR